MSRTMTRALAVLTVALLLAACGTSGGGATATKTVTRTVTAAPSAPADSSDLGDASIPGGASIPAGSASPAGSADAAAPDACSVLTPAQAQKVAGTPLLKPIGAGMNSAGKYVMCQYDGPTSGPTAELEVYIGDGAKQQLHIDRDNLKHTFTPVPGVGDQCLQEDGFIFVEKNGLWASLHLVRLNDPKVNVQPMRTGIREVAAKLP